MVSVVNNTHTRKRVCVGVCVYVYTLAMVPLIFAGERKLGMQEREAREREQVSNSCMPNNSSEATSKKAPSSVGERESLHDSFESPKGK